VSDAWSRQDPAISAQAEEQINDRLSFQKFVQLDTHEAVPDETTICRFRQRLIECGLHEELLGLLNAQLEARGYIVKRVTLVDATLVESSRKRRDAQAAREGRAPDAEASYTRKPTFFDLAVQQRGSANQTTGRNTGTVDGVESLPLEHANAPMKNNKHDERVKGNRFLGDFSGRNSRRYNNRPLH